MTPLNPEPQLVDGVDIDAVTAAVRLCPGVDDLAPGALGSVASYLPGRTVAGIGVGQDRVTVQVRSRWAVPAREVAAQVQSAVRGLVGKRRVDVVIADIAEPGHTEISGSGTLRAAAGASGRQTGEAGAQERWNQPSSGPPDALSSAPIIPTPAAIPPNS